MSEFAAQVQCYCAVATEGHLWSPAEGCTRSPVPETASSPAAPAAEADLREEIGKWLVANLFWGIDYRRGPEAAERLLAEVPALQRLVAEAAEVERLRETVARVSALVPRITELAEFEQEAERDAEPLLLVRDHLGRALDGEGTDG